MSKFLHTLSLIMIAVVFGTLLFGLSKTVNAQTAKGTVEVWTFNDKNSDGVKNWGESGIPHVTVSLHVLGTTEIGHGETNEEGYIIFNDLSAGGDYHICAEGKPDWLYTTEKCITLSVIVNEVTRVYVGIQLLSEPGSVFLPQVMN